MSDQPRSELERHSSHNKSNFIEAPIAGIELMHRIRKGQFKLGKFGVKGKTALEIWSAVLASCTDSRLRRFVASIPKVCTIAFEGRPAALRMVATWNSRFERRLEHLEIDQRLHTLQIVPFAIALL